MLLAAMLAATGTHWILLQSVAWTTMLARNLAETSLVRAVDRTFDGRHPCPLCKAIARGKQAEKKSAFPLELKKFEFFHARENFAFIAPNNDFWLLPDQNAFAASLTRSPPSPPPRAA